MNKEDIKINEWYLINGRKLKVIDNVNYLGDFKPYLLLQGEVGGELKMYHENIKTIEKLLKFICIKPWLAITQGDIVEVEIGPQVYIKHKKVVRCTNEFILNMHFEKLEEE